MCHGTSLLVNFSIIIQEQRKSYNIKIPAAGMEERILFEKSRAFGCCLCYDRKNGRRRDQDGKTGTVYAGGEISLLRCDSCPVGDFAV
jgi:hypothetical protein